MSDFVYNGTVIYSEKNVYLTTNSHGIYGEANLHRVINAQNERIAALEAQVAGLVKAKGGSE